MPVPGLADDPRPAERLRRSGVALPLRLVVQRYDARALLRFESVEERALTRVTILKIASMVWTATMTVQRESLVERMWRKSVVFPNSSLQVAAHSLVADVRPGVRARCNACTRTSSDADVPRRMQKEMLAR